MTTQRTRLCVALIGAFGGTALGLPAAQAQDVQRIEITGSAIKRTNAEGPAPVEILTRKEIERTGATSLNELLHSIPSIDIFDQGELASNSPAASGTASIRLRGLSSSETLVLLNGRRLPVNALYDSSGAGAAFDINSLPVGAIERIEILKDGGSAIYGADAVAGVVNFITKSDYQGIEATASYGVSSRGDGAERRLGLSAGFGDYGEDRYNILLGLDYFKRDPILRKDRDISRSVDFRRFGAQVDGRSSFSPYGNVIDPNEGTFVGLTYRDCPPDQLGDLNRCRYDFNASLLTAYNGADRLSGLALGSFQVTPDIKGFAEFIFSTSKDTFLAHPVPDFFIVPISDEAQRPYEILDDEGNGTDSIYIAGRFMQGGPRTTKRKSDFLNVAAGFEGYNFGLDWKLSASLGESKVTNSDSNFFDANLWAAATSDGSIDPTVTTNDQALVDSLKVTPQRVGKSVLETLNAQVSGDLFDLPGGTSKYAVGGAFYRDTLKDTPDPLSQQGLVVGSIQQSAVDAARNSAAVYGELQLPIFKTLEGQLAVRYDHYPKWSATSPKLGLKYTPTSSLAFRGSYTQSFRAPVLKQLFGAQEEGATTLTKDSDCEALGVEYTPGNCLINAFQVNGSNPDLGPEKGKTLNLGVIFDASSMFSASVDLWKIGKKNEISAPTLTDAIAQGLWAKIGPRYFIYTNLQNIAERETSGVDVDARLRLGETPVGKVSLRNLLTYYSSDRSKAAQGDPWSEYLGTYAKPYFRNALQAQTEWHDWTLSGTWKTVGGFWDSDQAYPDAIAASHNRKVGTFEELDLQAQYSGFGGWEFTAGIKNALDRTPPLSLQNGTSNTYTQMGFAELYSSRGRFFYLAAKYAFR
ncbi:MAG: TonB-dependent receptor [Burkholderiaceae bacterium]